MLEVFMNFLKLALLFLMAGLFINCSGSNNSDCLESDEFCETKSGGGASPVVNTLKLNCEDSDYYDSNIQVWKGISKTRLEAGDIGTISIFSNILTTDLSVALNSAQNSKLHLENKDDLYTEADFNKIPFIKCRVGLNEKISFEFKKTDGTNTAIVRGDAKINGEYAYIPFVNEIFKDQFLSYGSTPSSINDLNYTLTLQAKSPNANPSPLKPINFKINLKVPLKGIKVNFSNTWKEYSLKTRWNHYYSGGDEVVNDKWEFASLIDNQETADSIPYDIRFIFKSTPVLRMRQRVFVEEPLDLLIFKTLGVNILSRGERFYEHTQELDSNNHFRSKFMINNSFVPLELGTNLEKRNIPAGQKWKLSFVYDFTKSLSFNANYDLLTPLKTECQKISSQKMLPINEQSLKDAASLQGNTMISCSPTTNKSETFPKGSNASEVDTHFGYFNYRKDQIMTSSSPNTEERDAGNFNGIRSVDFYIEGCVKFLIREASPLETNPNPWEQKNIPDTECGAGDFTYFAIDAGDSIFNHVDDFRDNLYLVNLINRLGASTVRNKNNFHFNNSSFLEVIY